METVYIATKNKGKIKEFEHFFNKNNIKVKSLLDIDQSIEIEETGKTFEENALIKAHTICDLIQIPVLADDSGLEVDILNNEPGIYSARYAGVHGNDLQNNIKLLENLKDIPYEKRTAHFVCALALVYPSGKEIVVRGTCEGYIIEKMRGENGFGYDPLFFIPSLNKTYAELTKNEKMYISHRGNALEKLEKVFIND
ncbi:XTP/dITP diphosphatase [Mycoplasmatota bacterium]|nr:XTP/dITP diphosphatase [Mycoplasmatota bacterium]